MWFLCLNYETINQKNYSVSMFDKNYAKVPNVPTKLSNYRVQGEGESLLLVRVKLLRWGGESLLLVSGEDTMF